LNGLGYVAGELSITPTSTATTQMSDPTKCVLPTNSDNSAGHTITQSYPYIVNGRKGSIELTLNQQLRDYLGCRSDEMGPSSTSYKNTTTCDLFKNCKSSNTTSKFERPLELINESKKYSALKPLVDAIKSKTPDQEMQARIAINLVQQIPYNCIKAQAMTNSNYSTSAYHFDSPYEVLYENSGMCSEKSVLLASLLNELGYESAYLNFETDRHTMAGIRGSGRDQFLNTDYIVIESTVPTPVGYIPSFGDSNSVVVKLLGESTFYLKDQDRIDSQNFFNFFDKTNEGRRFSNNEVLLAKDLIQRYGDPRSLC
jgi:hypothetical protein